MDVTFPVALVLYIMLMKQFWCNCCRYTDDNIQGNVLTVAVIASGISQIGPTIISISNAATKGTLEPH